MRRFPKDSVCRRHPPKACGRSARTSISDPMSCSRPITKNSRSILRAIDSISAWDTRFDRIPVSPLAAEPPMRHQWLIPAAGFLVSAPTAQIAYCAEYMSVADAQKGAYPDAALFEPVVIAADVK